MKFRSGSSSRYLMSAMRWLSNDPRDRQVVRPLPTSVFTPSPLSPLVVEAEADVDIAISHGFGRSH